MWETFLKVEHAGSELDHAIAVLRLVRYELIPLVRRLERERSIEWYSFLVHAYGSGVPTVPGDTSAYIHLRLGLTPSAASTDVSALIPSAWSMTRRIVPPACEEIGGLETAMMVGGEVERAWWMIGEQTEWLFSLIEQHVPDVDDLKLLQHIGQFLHYFSNMTGLQVR